MKKLISALLALCLLLAMGAMAEGKPTAIAVLDQEAQAVIVTVDLTGGWSVEFAPGAFYLYDGEVNDEEPASAIGLTLDKEVYEEYLAEAQRSESCREIENGVCYVADDGTYYVLSVGTSAYFLLDVIDDADGGDAIFERIELVNQEDYYAELAEDSEAEADEEETQDGDSPVTAFEGMWVAGRAVLVVSDEGDEVHCTIEWGSSATESTVWEYECTYDEGTGTLTSLENGEKYSITYGEDGDVANEELIYGDGSASFVLNEDGTLTWTDFKETPGQDEMVFEKGQ